MTNDNGLLFGECLFLVYLSALAFGVHKCGQLKDEIKKLLKK